MNTPNPLIPQGTLDRPSKGKSTVRIAIFTIISIHAVFFAGLLMQGCRPDATKAGGKLTDAATNQNTLPALETGYYSGAPETAQNSNTPLPTNTAPATVSEAVSTFPPAALSEPAVEGKSYTIARGDTLAKIAKVNGTTVGAITKANPSVDPAKLKPGQKLQIPAAAAPTTAGIGFQEPAGTEPAASSGQVHVVKAGDTLTKIAKQHATSVKAIRAANNLKSDRLVAGQKLKLPAAHIAHATADGAKSSKTSKTASAAPAHVTPVASNSGDTTSR